MKVKISPSMMCADIFSLKETLDVLKEENIEFLHVDVMDGQFVQNYMLGTDYIKNIRTMSPIPLDIHLMIEKPEEKIGWFGLQKGDYVSIHAESTKHLQRVLSHVREYSAHPIVAINPATPLSAIEEILDDVDGVLVMTVNPGFAGQKIVPHTLDKISRVRKLLDEKNFHEKIVEVDGNVSIENAIQMRKSGADTFVTGTSCMFTKDKSLSENIRYFREIVQ